MRLKFVGPQGFKPAWNLGSTVWEPGCPYLHSICISGAGDHVDIWDMINIFKFKKFKLHLHVIACEGWIGEKKAACLWVSQDAVFESLQWRGKRYTYKRNALCWLAWQVPRKPLVMTWSWKKCCLVGWGDSKSFGGTVQTVTMQLCSSQDMCPVWVLREICILGCNVLSFPGQWLCGFQQAPWAFWFLQLWATALPDHS